MTERKVGDVTVCSQCGAPAKYVSLSTFEQYEPSRIQYTPPELIAQLKGAIQLILSQQFDAYAPETSVALKLSRAVPVAALRAAERLIR